MRQYKKPPFDKRYNNNNRRPPQRRGWKPPSHLSPYERSVWLMNSFTGRVVKLRPNESTDNLLRRFKKKVEQGGILKDFKKSEYYLSPSQKRRLKHKEALKRARKLEKKLPPRDYDSKPNTLDLRDDIFGLD